METLEIQIIGRAGAGKSTVAAIIKAQFEQMGLKCEIVEGKVDSGFTQDEWIKRMLSLQDHTLKIHTIHVDPEILPEEEKTP